MRWKISTLGRLHATRGSRTLDRFRTQKTAALLAYLALRTGRPVPREELIELFWPGVDISAGRQSLSKALSWLRNQLEAPRDATGSVLGANRQEIELVADSVETDIGEFERLLGEARSCEDRARRAECLRSAIELYIGPFLSGFYEDWILRERSRISDLHLDALEELAEISNSEGEPRLAGDLARRVLSLDPVRESAHRLLIRLYLESGDRVSALRQFDVLTELLQEELGASPDHETTDLLFGTDTDDSRDVARIRVPTLLTRFVGRGRELNDLRSKLQDPGIRLVTITGIGGVGKTRVAIETARGAGSYFPAGVTFVALHGIDRADRIPDEIRDSLEIAPVQGSTAEDQLALEHASQRHLLILDNLEHLIPEAAEIIARLFGRLPGISILATSRRLLGIDGEHEFALPPLTVPEHTSIPSPELVAHSGPDLFRDRAEAIVPGFRITDRNASAIADICIRLDGLPLAIELAAARVGVLTPAQIARRLASGTSFLSTEKNGIDERHRTLEAAVDWSVRLVSPTLRKFLEQLTVFPGSWSLEAAEEVCEEPVALDYLAQLRENSLLQSEEIDGEMRFSMLGLVREIVSRRLSEKQRLTLRRKLAAYFLEYVSTAIRTLRERGNIECVPVVRRNQEALRLTWRVLLQDGARKGSRGIESIEAAIQFSRRLTAIWCWIGRISEIRGWLEHLIDLIERRRPSSAHVAAYYNLGTVLVYAREYSKARQTLEKGLRLSRTFEKTPYEDSLLAFLSAVCRYQGELDVGIEYSRASMDLSKAAGNLIGVANSHHNLGSLYFLRKDLDEAEDHFRKGLEAWRTVGNQNPSSQDGIASSISALGSVAVSRKDYPTACGHFQEAIQIRRDVGIEIRVPHTLNELGSALLGLGEIDRAVEAHVESVTLFHSQGDRHGMAESCGFLATALHRRGDFEISAGCLGAREELRDPPTVAEDEEQGWQDGGLSTDLREKLGESTLRDAVQRGHELPIGELVRLVEETCQRVRTTEPR